MQFDNREITAIEKEFKKRFKNGLLSVSRNVEKGEIIFALRNKEENFLWTVNEEELSYATGSEEVVEIVSRKIRDMGKKISKEDFVMKRLLENT